MNWDTGLKELQLKTQKLEDIESYPEYVKEFMDEIAQAEVELTGRYGQIGVIDSRQKYNDLEIRRLSQNDLGQLFCFLNRFPNYIRS